MSDDATKGAAQVRRSGSSRIRRLHGTDEERLEINSPRRAFGRAIVHQREVKGWSQYDLATRFGVSQATVGAWERAENMPSPDDIFALEKTFGLKPGELSRHLGFVPASLKAATQEPTVEWVLGQDPKLRKNEAAQRVLLDLYRILVDVEQPPRRRPRGLESSG